MINLCTWNVRGLNDPAKVTEVKNLINTHNIKVIALFETRIKPQNCSKYVKKFGRHWQWEMNYSCCDWGRIWLGWKPSFVTVSVCSVSTQVIHCEITEHVTGNPFFYSVVYGLHSVDTRKLLWSDLGNIADSVNNHTWLISGDFNTMLNLTDRINGSAVTLHEILDFSDFVTAYGLTVLNSIGHYFCWHKGGVSNSTASRIDWCLGNSNWTMTKTDVVTEYLNPSTSDHSPILLSCIENVVGGGRPFKFFYFLADHHSFMSIIENCWSAEVKGTLMFSVWSRLKMIKDKLKNLHNEEFKGIHEKIDLARNDLHDIQTQLQFDYSDASLLLQESDKVAVLKKWLNINESALRKKSRI
ncbi:uncharacterized protein LOC110692050 [Chenopodium quinoa]|uniref:uncharacterized protein LOC110692050 n=1 Tax=Chenopodium quinoa TaxID=63459 RepID=UPI000B76F7D3|nr:uncharacterized protein LOC110692050 [Chenopodium quinoa]